MPVFKLFLYLLKKNITVLIVYIAIFCGIAVLFGNVIGGTGSSEFETKKTNCYLKIEEDTEITKSVDRYLSKYINKVNIDDTKIDDALYYNEIDLYICIKQGFSEKLFTNDDKLIHIKSTPDSMYAFQLENNLSSYLQKARSYVENGLATKDTVFNELEKIDRKVEEETLVTIEKSNKQSTKINFYFDYIAYLMGALILSMVQIVMLALRPLDIKRRMQISALEQKKSDRIMLLCNMGFGVVVSLLLIFLSFVVYGSEARTISTLYYGINVVLFSAVCISLGYLINILISGRMIIEALGVIIPLGGAFLSGVFVPQEFMDNNVLLFARILPQYWYIKSNIYIESGDINGINLFISYIPQLIYIVIFVVAIIIARKVKAKQEV